MNKHGIIERGDLEMNDKKHKRQLHEQIEEQRRKQGLEPRKCKY